MTDQDGTPRDAADAGCSGPGCGAVAQVAPGVSHTCALLQDNSVWCWGGGDRGQLGDGRRQSSVSRVQVSFPDPAVTVVQLASGGEHSCALTDKGEVYCWGDDSGVQASGSNGSPDTSRPVQVLGLPGTLMVTRLALGYRHSCALAGTYVWCWGDNSRGQQAQSGGTAFGPHQVPLVVGASEVTCGDNHCCARQGDKVRCWGDNGYGQVGPVKQDPVTTPTVHPSLSGVGKLRCGGSFCCAALTDDTVSCWGDNGVGQLGDTSHASYHPEPFPVPGVTAVDELAMGEGHACALAQGKALCWGYNRYGQLGIGADDDETPKDVAGLSGLTGLGAGKYHTCVIGSSGELWCWGDNIQGQIGNGEATRDPTPSAVPSLAPSTLAVGGLHTCALQNTTVSCWGYGMYGQLGDGQYHVSATPVTVSGATQWASIGRGALHSCAVERTTGRVWCWGASWLDQCGPGGSGLVSKPVLVSASLGGVEQVAAAHDHSCARGKSGVHCWGSNAHGQLGVQVEAGPPGTPQPVSVPLAAAIDVRGASTCMLDANSAIACWGRNNVGQLGNNADVDSDTPVKVQLAKPAAGVAVGGYHACAVTTDGEVWCWGDNTSGQLGVPVATAPWRSLTPVQADLPADAEATQVTAGWSHTCARTAAGEVYCWGHNGARQLGRDGVEASATPEPVKGLPAATSVHAGWDYTCALDSAALGAQTVRCWGSWFFGQLGDGRVSKTWTPVRIN